MENWKGTLEFRKNSDHMMKRRDQCPNTDIFLLKAQQKVWGDQKEVRHKKLICEAFSGVEMIGHFLELQLL